MSHLVFPVHSTIPGVSDRLGWNGEIVLLVQAGVFINY